MNKGIFRGIVILNLLLAFGCLPISLIEEPKLPLTLIRFLAEQEVSEVTFVDNAFLFADIIGLSSMVGLLFFARWAKIIYIIALPTLSISMYFYGPSVTGPITTVFAEFQLITNGIILTLLFYPPISEYFNKSDNKILQSENPA